MRKATYSDDIQKYATVKQACDYAKLSRNTLMNLAEKGGAVRRIGRKVLIDVQKLDAEINLH